MSYRDGIYSHCDTRFTFTKHILYLNRMEWHTSLSNFEEAIRSIEQEKGSPNSFNITELQGVGLFIPLELISNKGAPI